MEVSFAKTHRTKWAIVEPATFDYWKVGTKIGKWSGKGSSMFLDRTTRKFMVSYGSVVLLKL
jgi:hypothetical protein